MKAALLLAPKRIEIREVDAPRVGAGQVLIQPARVGICGSDVSFYLGHRTLPYPFVLGHETIGRVVALGDAVTNFEIGQRVIVEPNYPCGVCAFCRAGRGNICPHKTSLGVSIAGCFADAFVAPAEFVWHVPDDISDADAVVIEPLAVSLHALWQSRARMGDTIAVIGCGATGLLLIHAAVAQGIRVLAHDRVADKLALARQLGAVMVVEGGDIAQLWRDENVTTVFECAGASATVELALSAARQPNRADGTGDRASQFCAAALGARRPSGEWFAHLRSSVRFRAHARVGQERHAASLAHRHRHTPIRRDGWRAALGEYRASGQSGGDTVERM